MKIVININWVTKCVQIHGNITIEVGIWFNVIISISN